MKKLPSKIYGYWETQTGNYRTSERAGELVGTGETRKVGVYELIGYAVVSNKIQTTTKALKSKKR